jgi:hypothetical protein
VWCKQIRGKLLYYGPWDDPDGALKKYMEQRDDRHAGRTPRPDAGTFTIKDACNAFLNAIRSLMDSGELATLTVGDYMSACNEIVAAFGKTRLLAGVGPDDF